MSNIIQIPGPPFLLPPIPPRRAQHLDRGQRVALYLAGSTALRDILQLLGVTGFKVGLTGRRHVNERIVDLRGRRYASIFAPMECRDQAIIASPQGHEWFLAPLPDPDEKQMQAIAALPGGSLRSGVLEFLLPPGMSVTEIDRTVQRLLAPRDLNAYLDTDDGKMRLREAGFPETARLFTDYDLIGRPRRSLAIEICCIRPRREFSVLIEAVHQALRC
jgi:hypothetical protein